MKVQDESISAVHSLEGRILKTGWEVIEKVKIKPSSTGGYFSVCYIVKKDNKIGFLKAINILKFLQEDSDLLESTTIMLNAYNFERDILQRCTSNNLSKVSKLLEASFENVPGYLIPNVYYIIFEKADGDVREHINFSKFVDNAWKLRSLHNIATGVKQLHSLNISHQDLKPSNVFVFDRVISKIGDLGRALCDSLNAPHSNLNFSGDNNYAPPEVYHRYVLPDWKDKVFAIDCYLLGSMAVYYFTGITMNGLLAKNLPSSINILSLNFENALPYWIKAFDEALEIIKNHTNDITHQDKLIKAIRMLCNPDPRKRGHVKNINSTGNNYRLERFVETFNLLARKAEYNLTK